MIGTKTLKGIVARLGATRVQQAIDDQRDWLRSRHKGDKHSELCLEIRKSWPVNPRRTLHCWYVTLSFAGFKSDLDSYLMIAFALGKLKVYGIR